MQAYFGRHPRPVIDREHIKPARTIADMSLPKKSPRRPHYHSRLVRRDAQFRQRSHDVAHRPRAHFHKRQRFPVVPKSDQSRPWLHAACSSAQRTHTLSAANTNTRRSLRERRFAQPTVSASQCVSRHLLAPEAQTPWKNLSARRANRCAQPSGLLQISLTR